MKKDPKNQILFFSRNGEEWPSDDSEDSDYLPSDDDDDRTKKKDKVTKKLKKEKHPRKSENDLPNIHVPRLLPQLPAEIWLKIFQDVVKVAGPLPFLCRAQKVCTQWKALAVDPSLWKKVDLSYGWIKAKEETLQWLSENRLSQCEDINLSGWTLSSALKMLTENCPHLQCVNLSNCKKLTADGVVALADNCSHLMDIDLSGTGVTSVALKDLIQKRCATLKRIDISHNSKLPGFNTVLECIMKCPMLTVLDISNIDNVPTYITIDLEEFHKSCPKLKVLRMGNNRYKGVPKSDDELDISPGFPDLEEFRIFDLSGKNFMHSTVVYDVFYRILHNSVKLKVLDIRGRCNEACSVLSVMPATDVESLHIGLSSTQYDDPYLGLFLKWRHSLRIIDLSWTQNVELAIDALASGPFIPLEHINLTGSNIVTRNLRSLLDKSPHLKHIQLESCRNLFRGIKRSYQGEEIKILKNKLKNS